MEAISIFGRQRNANRNIVIFLLIASLGMERSQLANLKWDSFGKGYKYIMINEKKIELCPLLQDYLLQLEKEMKMKRAKSTYVFLTFHKGKYRHMPASNINDIFDELKNISKDDKWKNYSPKYVRNCLIGTLYDAGYSLEEIMYITGIDIKNISKYISKDKILEKENCKIDWSKVYNGLLCARP